MDTSAPNAHAIRQTQSRNGDDYYVYVYIDPRNLEEFYFGKGKGSRKNAHLTDDTDSEKTRRIKAIRVEGLEPIIRVIARGLTEHEALFMESAYLWKLGKNLTNIASGYYATRFRPQDTLHKLLSGFDYQCGIYYYSVGECEKRNWDDYRTYGIISGGGGKRWREPMLQFQEGDIVAAYLSKDGYVGIGRITVAAKPIRHVMIDGRPLLSLPLTCKCMDFEVDSNDQCEYVARVEWISAVPRGEGKWQNKSGLYSSQHVRASLDAQPATLHFLEQAFSVDMGQLAT